MITSEDIHKIILAMSNVFYDKQAIDRKFDEQKESFNILQNSIDSFSYIRKNYEEEILVLNHRVGQLEKGK